MKGDSGAMVVDATNGTLYGHVIGWSPIGEVYISPYSEIIHQVRYHFAEDDIALPNPKETLRRLQESYKWGSDTLPDRTEVVQNIRDLLSHARAAQLARGGEGVQSPLHHVSGANTRRSPSTSKEFIRTGSVRSWKALKTVKDSGALHEAARELNLLALEALLAVGADPNLRSRMHGVRTPLGELCLRVADYGPLTPARERLVERAMRLLIDHGTDLTKRFDGKSVLFLAFRSKDPVPTVRALLNAGMSSFVTFDSQGFFSDGIHSYPSTDFPTRQLPEMMEIETKDQIIELLRASHNETPNKPALPQFRPLADVTAGPYSNPTGTLETIKLPARSQSQAWMERKGKGKGAVGGSGRHEPGYFGDVGARKDDVAWSEFEGFQSSKPLNPPGPSYEPYREASSDLQSYLDAPYREPYHGPYHRSIATETAEAYQFAAELEVDEGWWDDQAFDDEEWGGETR
jgi:hypothetical protein